MAKKTVTNMKQNQKTPRKSISEIIKTGVEDSPDSIRQIQQIRKPPKNFNTLESPFLKLEGFI